MRYSNGTLYYVESGTNTFRAIELGLIDNEVINRDCDGDGKTNIGVWRETDGTY